MATVEYYLLTVEFTFVPHGPWPTDYPCDSVDRYCLATIMNRETVAAYAGISLRSVEHILAHFNKTQTIKMPPEDNEVVAKRYLRDYDTRVCVLL
jgi:hypothetical protein